MGTSTIDGTVEEASLKRERGGFALYDDIRFRLDDGSTRTIKKPIAAAAVAEQLKPGSRARYYLFTSFDVKGVHGVRRSDGTAVFGFPGNNAKIFLIVAIVNLVWILARLAIDGGLPLLAVLLVILGGIGYVLTSRTQREARQQFESDGNPVAPPPLAAVPPRVVEP